MSDKVLETLEDQPERKAIAQIAAEESDALGSHFKSAVDDALTWILHSKRYRLQWPKH